MDNEMAPPALFEANVETAYTNLTTSVCIDGPIDSGTHKTYAIRGLADTPEQLESLCWCILSFLDKVNEVEFKLESLIGDGEIARKNLKDSLLTSFDIGAETEPSQESKDRKRNPLIAEFIAHILVHIHRRRAIFPEWIGQVCGCRNPHTFVNDAGVDLVALGLIDIAFMPAFGEVKAYANDPVGGFDEACKKFTQVRKGTYNKDIRETLCNLSINQGLSRQDLANAIWQELNHFGAFVSFDDGNGFDLSSSIERKNVTNQPPEKLFLILMPYAKMHELFDLVSETLLRLADSLGGVK